MVIENNTLVRYTGASPCVTVPEGVTEIGGFAFENREDLREVTLPRSLRAIGACAFSHCAGLERLALPEHLETLDFGAFQHCTGLRELDFPAGIRALPEFLCSDCAALSAVRLPEGLTEIDAYAFYGCGALGAVDLPEGLRYIGHNAFSRCTSLRRLVLPGLLAGLHRYALSGCTGLRELVVLPRGNRPAFRSFRTFDDYCCQDCSALERLVLPPSVQQVGPMSFDGCYALREIVYDGTAYGAEAERGPEPVRKIIRSIHRPRRQTRTPARHQPFPPGYPYRDEFDYLSRDGDDED